MKKRVLGPLSLFSRLDVLAKEVKTKFKRTMFFYVCSKTGRCFKAPAVVQNLSTPANMFLE